MARFTQDVPVEIDGYEIIASVTYSYIPGRPAFTPRGEYAPIDPPEPPECNVQRVEVDGKPVPDWFERAIAASDRVYEWLASNHQEPTPEYERE